MRPLRHIHAVPHSDLVALHVQRHGPSAAAVALSPQLLRPHLPHDAVVVDHGELFPSHSDDHAHLVRGSAAAQHHEIVQFISGQFILPAGDLRALLQLRGPHGDLLVGQVRQDYRQAIVAPHAVVDGHYGTGLVGIATVHHLDVGSRGDVFAHLAHEELNLRHIANVVVYAIRHGFDLDCGIAVQGYEFTSHPHEISINDFDGIAHDEASIGGTAAPPRCCRAFLLLLLGGQLFQE
mmetsp:Transcript_6546/g.9582  ORF Transcript_6546/g.9582 Transcript_6546/m.9582 type:complete len:236 (+) Transcript_6546:1594-2301(+)